MMASEPLLDIYGWLSEITLQILDHPRRATIKYLLDGKRWCLQLDNPVPLTKLLAVFEECYGFRIYDRNVEEGNHLEFGRYRIEVWCEDGPMAECTADRAEETAA